MKVVDDRYLTKWGSLTMSHIWSVMSFRSFQNKVYCLFTAQRHTVKMFSSHEMQEKQELSLEVVDQNLFHTILILCNPNPLINVANLVMNLLIRTLIKYDFDFWLELRLQYVHTWQQIPFDLIPNSIVNLDCWVR